jgi:hypothetical protein
MPRQWPRHLAHRAEVDLDQHRNDHHPDQQPTGRLTCATPWRRWRETRGQPLAEQDAGDDAQRTQTVR